MSDISGRREINSFSKNKIRQLYSFIFFDYHVIKFSFGHPRYKNFRYCLDDPRYENFLSNGASIIDQFEVYQIWTEDMI